MRKIVLSFIILLSSSSLRAQTLLSHNVQFDASGKVIPWLGSPDTAYDQVVSADKYFFLNAMPVDPATGQPAVLTQSSMNACTPPTAQNYDNSAADKFAYITDASLYDYQYSGDAAFVAFAESLLNFELQNGLTSSTAVYYPSVPCTGAYPAGIPLVCHEYPLGSGIYIEPDKIGQFGLALVRMYEHDANATYLTAAIHEADVLASVIRTGDATHSPWPFRVDPNHLSAPDQADEYTADALYPIKLFDELSSIGQGDVRNYQNARQIAWNWLLAYPMTTGQWSNFYSDIPANLSNFNNEVPLDFAKYLMDNPSADANWQTDAANLISQVESNLGMPQYGAEIIEEQDAYPVAMGEHTSRYASAVARYYELTGDSNSLEKAYRALNWSTYMLVATTGGSKGEMLVGPGEPDIWFDAAGDMIKEYIQSMAALPQYSPQGETHILRSSSVIVKVSYGQGTLSYKTFDNSAVEKIHLNFVPSTVTADGVPIETWVYDPPSAILTVSHGASNVAVLGGGGVASAPPTAPSIVLISDE